MNIKKNIIIIGAGGHTLSSIEVIEQLGTYNIKGLIDDNVKINTIKYRYPVLGSDKDLKTLRSTFDYAFIGLGQIKSSKLRASKFKLLKSLGYIIPKIISPRSFVSNRSTISEGSIIMNDVIINGEVKIGTNCIINNKTLIEHGCIIENDCHISTNVVLNGNVKVGEGTFIGSSSVISNDFEIRKNQFIKMGSIIY